MLHAAIVCRYLTSYHGVNVNAIIVSIFDLIMYMYTNEHEHVAALYMLETGNDQAR